MSDPASITSAAISGLDVIGGWVSRALDRKAQKTAYADFRSDTEIARQREDTAVQRRVEDMKAAGINPMLAAGNPATSQSAVMGEPPKTGSSPGIATIVQAVQQAKLAQAQTNLLNAQAGKIEEETDYLSESKQSRIDIIKRRNSLEENLEQTTLDIKAAELQKLKEQGQGEALLNTLRKQQEQLNNITMSTAQSESIIKAAEAYVTELTQERKIDESVMRSLTMSAALEAARLANDIAKRDMDIDKALGIKSGTPQNAKQKFMLDVARTIIGGVTSISREMRGWMK